jgi:hypothetical protein
MQSFYAEIRQQDALLRVQEKNRQQVDKQSESEDKLSSRRLADRIKKICPACNEPYFVLPSRVNRQKSCGKR